MGPSGQKPLPNPLLVVLSKGSNAPCVPKGSCVPLSPSWACGLLKAETSGWVCTGGREPAAHFLHPVLTI